MSKTYNRRKPLIIASILLAFAGSNAVLFVLLIQRAQSGPDGLAEPQYVQDQGPYKAYYFPEIEKRAQNEIDTLSTESLDVALNRMNRLTEYHSSDGIGSYKPDSLKFSLPIASQHYMYDVHRIISNRRFRFLCQLAKSGDSEHVSKLIGRELRSSYETYMALHEKYIERTGQLFTKNSPLEIYSISHPTSTPNDGSECLEGERLKILSLIILAGHLDSTMNREIVKTIAREAKNTFDDILKSSTYHDIFKYDYAVKVSLFNPIVIGSSLLQLYDKLDSSNAGSSILIGVAGPSVMHTKYNTSVQIGAVERDLRNGEMSFSIFFNISQSECSDLIISLE